MRKPSLSPDFKRHLATSNPLGMQLSEDDVQAWFDYVWIRYSTHNYTRHKRAISNWWSRVREDEIEAARERVARIADERDTARLEALAKATGVYDPAHLGPFMVDYSAKLS